MSDPSGPPIFVLRQLREAECRAMAAEMEVERLRVALQVATMGTEPRDDLVMLMADYLATVPCTPEVAALLGRAEELGWEPS